jgi:hypothetical protein
MSDAFVGLLLILRKFMVQNAKYTILYSRMYEDPIFVKTLASFIVSLDSVTLVTQRLTL